MAIAVAFNNSEEAVAFGNAIIEECGQFLYTQMGHDDVNYIIII